MPTSSKYGKLYTALMINKLNELAPIESILDIGVGEGTYFDILSPYLKNTKWSGIEAWEPYITKYNLRRKYKTFMDKDIHQINFDEVSSCHLLILGNVVEHMTKQ